MISTLFLSVTVLVTHVHAMREFGLLHKANHVETIRGLLELEQIIQYDMSLSMSMSMAYITTKQPAMAPSQDHSKSSPAPSGKHHSVSPSVIVFPLSQVPSTIVSLSPMVSPTALPTSQSTIAFQCDKYGAIVTSIPGNVTTKLDLKFTYEAQINSVTLEDALVHELELAFLSTAVGAVLDCNATLRHLQVSEYHHVSSSTSMLGSCTATIDNATCFWLETNLAVTVNGDMNPLYAAYKAYGIIQSGMMNDTFVNVIDELEKLTYLTPTLPVGVETLQPLNSLEGNVQSGGKKHPQWILASGLTLLGVGSIALAALVSKNHLDKSKNKAALMQDDLLTDTSSLEVPEDHVAPQVESV